MLSLKPDIQLRGVLVPLFALRGSQDLGIGDTEALHELIDWAAKTGLRLIQLLPINETGSDHSPYNILSSMAIEPSTLAATPRSLPDLTKKDFVRIASRYDLAALRQGAVRYSEVKALKRELLEAAFVQFSQRGKQKRRRAWHAFCKEHEPWLKPYTLFRSLVHLQGQSEILDLWPEEQRTRATAELWAQSLPEHESQELATLQEFYSYVQWIAYSQWLAVRKYAEKRGVALMGDIPVGVSIYGADVWMAPHLFDSRHSCGAPPEKVFQSDPFTEKWGQNWGFPLYDWYAMSQDNFEWWRHRLRSLCSLFHLLRVDHALGFFRIYSFPWRPQDNECFTVLNSEQARAITGGELPCFKERDDSSEENRKKNRLHGEVLLRLFLEETGPHRLIAEDLGEVPPYVQPALAALEIPGIKIPFWERNAQGKLLPGSQYPRISLATYATHDHPPLKCVWEKWWHDTQCGTAEEAAHAQHAMQELLDFAGASSLPLPQPFTSEIHAALLEGLFASNSWLVVPMITDLFGWGLRFNIPGTFAHSNWGTRIEIPVTDFSIYNKATR